MHLLAADRVRFGRRRDLRLLVALVPVVLAFMFIAEFNSITTPPQANFVIDPPDPVQEAELKDQMLADWHDELARELPAFAFPASLVKVAGNSPPLILLAIYLATALVAGEFEWGTVRTIHLTSRRGRTLAVRVGVVIGLMAVVAATGLLFAAILPFLLSFEGKSIQSYATPVPDLATAIAGRLTVVLPFIAVPVLMAIVARSIGVRIPAYGARRHGRPRRDGCAVLVDEPGPVGARGDDVRIDRPVVRRLADPRSARSSGGVGHRAPCLGRRADPPRDLQVPSPRPQRVGGPAWWPASWGLVAADPVGFQVTVFFLGCVIVAGCFGAATVSRRILVVQAVPGRTRAGRRPRCQLGWLTLPKACSQARLTNLAEDRVLPITEGAAR